MITGLIVTLSLLLAGLYGFAYWRYPELRRQIEQPKYRFQSQLQRFDYQHQEMHSINAAFNPKGEPHESR